MHSQLILFLIFGLLPTSCQTLSVPIGKQHEQSHIPHPTSPSSSSHSKLHHQDMKMDKPQEKEQADQMNSVITDNKGIPQHPLNNDMYDFPEGEIANDFYNDKQNANHNTENRYKNDDANRSEFKSTLNNIDKIPDKSYDNAPQKNVVYAFTAQLSADRDFSRETPIIFDQTLQNVGNLYFNTTGQFPCVDEAIYVFLWTASRHLSGSQEQVSTSLRVGGEILKYGPKSSYLSGFISGNSQMVSLVQCRTSVPTAVTVIAAQETVPDTWLRAGLNSFSGFRLSRAENTIGFTAELSSDVPIYPGGRIVFDQDIYNFGNHYERQHGYFRCPDHSIYSFTVTTHSPQTTTHQYQWSTSRIIFANDTDRFVYYGPMTFASTSSHSSDSASISIVLQCREGWDVYVQSAETYEFGTNIYGAALTSFTGFRLCENCSNYVAFSAVLSSNVTSDGQVVFGDVITNHGSAYNPSSGNFTCPDDNYYLFSWSGTCMNYCNLDLHQDLTQTKLSHIARTNSYADERGATGTDSMSTVVKCSTGSFVWINASPLSTSRILLAHYTSFSGYKIPGQG